jgi:hypothetical protein
MFGGGHVYPNKKGHDTLSGCAIFTLLVFLLFEGKAREKGEIVGRLKCADAKAKEPAHDLWKDDIITKKKSLMEGRRNFISHQSEC